MNILIDGTSRQGRALNPADNYRRLVITDYGSRMVLISIEDRTGKTKGSMIIDRVEWDQGVKDLHQWQQMQ